MMKKNCKSFVNITLIILGMMTIMSCHKTIKKVEKNIQTGEDKQWELVKLEIYDQESPAQAFGMVIEEFKFQIIDGNDGSVLSFRLGEDKTTNTEIKFSETPNDTVNSQIAIFVNDEKSKQSRHVVLRLANNSINESEYESSIYSAYGILHKLDKKEMVIQLSNTFYYFEKTDVN